MAKKKTDQPIVGKYILDTLSTGMYNNPLIVIREYIQNSVDAIDEIVKAGKLDKSKSHVHINIEWQSKSMTISDNGVGIPMNNAFSILTNIGKSNKSIESNRGFRGIGRLGGLSYCDKLTFKTKARGEAKYSESSWDCIKLKKLIGNKSQDIDVIELVQKVAVFSQQKYDGNKADHFFIVEMHGLKSGKNILLDIPLIKSYLSQVAPVPFDKESFSFSKLIEQKLRKYISQYETYNISVNNERIFKPYTDTVKISDKRKDVIKDINFILFSNGNGNLAYGWFAKLDLHGAINRFSSIDSVRVRSGNIMIGDKHLLSDFFRERRFNNYLIGEIHTVDNGLIPNSRRDDFEDNQHKNDFYNCFVKKIGLPYSLKIREASSLRSKLQKESLNNGLIEKSKNIIKYGYFSEFQKIDLIKKLRNLNGNNGSHSKDHIIDLIKQLEKSKHYLDLPSNSLRPSEKRILMPVFDVIYNKATNKNEAEVIIKNVIESKLVGFSKKI